LATGCGGQRAHQVRYVQPRAVTDESAASTRSRSIGLLVGAFAGVSREIGSRQTHGRTQLKALAHAVGSAPAMGPGT
jgi:hypothetical protein